MVNMWKAYNHAFMLIQHCTFSINIAKAYFRMDEMDLATTIDKRTPMEYLIPTAEGRGASTPVLMKYLVLVHNDFILSCIEIAKKQPERFEFLDIDDEKPSFSLYYPSKTPWEGRRIPLSRVQHCHLLDYEQELVPLVISHCHYAGASAHGQVVRCNLPALEKHILDKYIHGKPVILLEVPQVTYRRKRDVYTSTTLVAVRRNVPQVNISAVY